MTDAYKIFIGPVHPSLEEPIFFDFKIEGEKIIDVDLKPGNTHRGIEALGMQRNPIQLINLAERICGICCASHATTFCRAVEGAANIEVSDRANYIRTILCELERLHSHLLWAGLLAHEMGFHSVLHYGMKVRENVLDILEDVSGGRVHHGTLMIGGVRRDLTKAQQEKILQSVNYYKGAYKKLTDIFLHNRIIKMRTQNIGILTKKDAIELCSVGPTARGSGVNRDVRQDWAYLAYGDIGIKAQTPEGVRGKIIGDVFDRTIVRLLEIKQSAEIIEQCVDQMPSGELLAIPKIPVLMAKLKVLKAEGVGRQEAPRGELHHYVRFDNKTELDAWKVKPPTYNNLMAVKPMMKSMEIADIPVVVSSIDPCIACLDRITIVEEHKRKIVDKFDLHNLSVKKSKRFGKIEEWN